MRKHLARTSFAVILLVAVASTACAPAAGRITAQYRTTAQNLINAVAEAGIGIQPSSLYDYYSIHAIGSNFVTLHANSTMVLSLVMGGNTVILSFNASQLGPVATLVASGNRGSLGSESIELILQDLDRRFTRLN